jgi:hypothetical protein
MKGCFMISPTAMRAERLLRRHVSTARRSGRAGNARVDDRGLGDDPQHRLHAVPEGTADAARIPHDTERDEPWHASGAHSDPEHDARRTCAQDVGERLADEDRGLEPLRRRVRERGRRGVVRAVQGRNEADKVDHDERGRHRDNRPRAGPHDPQPVDLVQE